MSVVRRLAGWLLTAGAVLGALSLLLIAVGPFLGVRPLLFRSGSMSPTIETGDIAIARHVEARTLRVGDIVSVPTGQGDQRVAHRIVDLQREGDEASLTLRGDANEAPDAQSYVVDGVDRVVFVVPAVGHVVAAMTSPIGIFLSGLAAGGLLFLAVRGGGDRGQHRGGPGSPGRKTSRSTVAAVAAASLAAAGPAGAVAWTDDVSVTGTLTAYTVISQSQPTCTNIDGLLVLGNVARVSWSQVRSDYEYTWELRRDSDGTLSASGTVGSGVAQGSQVSVDISTGLIGVNTNYNVVVRARLAAAPLWMAATTTVTPVRRASIIIIGAAFRCGHA